MSTPGPRSPAMIAPASTTTAPSTQPPVIEPSIAAVLVDQHHRSGGQRGRALDLDQQRLHEPPPLVQPAHRDVLGHLPDAGLNAHVLIVSLAPRRSTGRRRSCGERGEQGSSEPPRRGPVVGAVVRVELGDGERPHAIVGQQCAQRVRGRVQ